MKKPEAKWPCMKRKMQGPKMKSSEIDNLEMKSPGTECLGMEFFGVICSGIKHFGRNYS